MITIRLLGQFEMSIGGEKALDAFAGSRRGRLFLLYLLLNKDEDVPFAMLQQALWDDETDSVPALKSLASRVRKALVAADPALAECFVARKGAYRWNPAVSCTIDAYDFQRLCSAFQKVTAWDADAANVFERASALYTGDVALEDEQKSWLSAHRTYYHTMYLQMIYHAIRLLTRNNEYDSVLRVCRRALELDAMDETLRLEMMEVLAKMEPNNEVYTQYQHSAPHKAARSPLYRSDKLHSLYRQIIQADQSLGIDMDGIRRTLEDNTAPGGPLVCEYTVFRDTFQLLMRSFSRMGHPIFLGVLMVSAPQDEDVDPMILDSAMHRLLASMITNLRRGDTVTRYSPSQYALLLPNVNMETGQMVMERIRSTFYGMHFNAMLTITYKLCPLEDMAPSALA